MVDARVDQLIASELKLSRKELLAYQFNKILTALKEESLLVGSSSLVLPDRKLADDLNEIIATIFQKNFNAEHFLPLLNGYSKSKLGSLFWEFFPTLVVEYKPLLEQDSVKYPALLKLKSFPGDRDYMRYIGKILENELGQIHHECSNFFSSLFQTIPNLVSAAKKVHEICTQGEEPLYFESNIMTCGWKTMAPNREEDADWRWLSAIVEKIGAIADKHVDIGRKIRKMPITHPKTKVQGSTDGPKLEVGFDRNPNAGRLSFCDWSQICIPGELRTFKSEVVPELDWLDFGRYAKRVLAAQETRRFVIGFTIHWSYMTIWKFDRDGCVCSEEFIITFQSCQFVLAILGFLYMTDEELGYDPTIKTVDNKRYIDIERNGQQERIVFTRLLKRDQNLAGLGTTSWAAYSENDADTQLVVTDTWRYPQEAEEGELLQEATAAGVVNVARYYHHSTIFSCDYFEPVVNCKDKECTDTADLCYPSARSMETTRVHRRVIVSDVGEPIYKANSHASLLAAVKSGIEGHRSLLNAGFLHKNITIDSVLIDVNDEKRGFLIDLSMAQRVSEKAKPDAKLDADAKAFRAIGLLEGDSEHTFMHDLEAFFWLLFWVFVLYDENGKRVDSPLFEELKSLSDAQASWMKRGIVGTEAAFKESAKKHFTPYYQPMIPMMTELCKEVTSLSQKGQPKQDMQLYERMCQILVKDWTKAQKKAQKKKKNKKKK